MARGTLPKPPNGVAGSSLKALLESTMPGFAFLQGFFSRWFNIDLTTLAVALAVFGSISSGTQQLRALTLTVYRWVTRFFTASISIPGDDRLNREVLYWIGSEVLLRQGTRILTARSENSLNDAWQSFSKIEYQEHGCPLPIQYLPTFDNTWFIHGFNLFLVRRIPDGRTLTIRASDSPDQYVAPPVGNDPLVIMCLGRSVKPIQKLLDASRHFAASRRESYVTVRSSSSFISWDTMRLQVFRPLQSIYMANKEDLVSDVANYLDPYTRYFYTTKNIPYRRGYLFHGPEGSGKTSLAVALAGRFSLEIYLLDLSSIRSDDELRNLFAALPPRCIVLLEDVDTVELKGPSDKDEDNDTRPREEGEEKERRCKSKCTLSGLLNVLDGATTQEGHMVILTARKVDMIHEAILRPGRIDKMVFMGFVSRDMAKDMFLQMYSRVSEKGREAELRSLAAQFSSSVPENRMTPAQIQGYLLDRRDQPALTVAQQAVSSDTFRH